MNLFLMIGILGMALILAAFLLVQTHKLTVDTLTYDFLNFLGSTLLVLYGIDGKVWPFVALNSVFALYSLKDVLFKDMKKGKTLRKA